MVEHKVLWTNDFEKSVKRVKDKELKKRVVEKVKKIVENPEAGKPLRYSLRGERTVYVKPYRILYAVTSDKIVLLKFKHRKEVYES